MTSIDDEIDESVHIPKGEAVILPRQERFITREDGKSGGVKYVSTLEPLAHYRAARQITPEQHRAGNKLHSLWRSSAFGEQYVTMRFGERREPGKADDRALVATEYFEACKAIANDFDRKTVLRVCCGGEFAGRRKRFAALLSGLDDLVKHFRIEN